jgi:hypothetical protein
VEELLLARLEAAILLELFLQAMERECLIVGGRLGGRARLLRGAYLRRGAGGFGQGESSCRFNAARKRGCPGL